MNQRLKFVVLNRNFRVKREVLEIWSKGRILDVCLFTSIALALAMAGRLAGQTSSTATEAPSDHDKQAQRSTIGGAHYKKLLLRQAQANPSRYSVRDDPCRRSLCEL
jgi:hypothetical protein